MKKMQNIWRVKSEGEEIEKVADLMLCFAVILVLPISESI